MNLASGSLYDEIADRYERWWAPVLAPAALTLLDEIASEVASRPGATILDLGTGTGTLAAGALGRWGAARVIGVDSSARMLALAQTAAIAADGGTRAAGTSSGRFRAIRADAGELPLPDASVDIVVSSFVLQLVDARRALAEVRRILRPGGLLAVVTWVGPDSPFEPDLALDDALDALDIELPDEDEDEDEDDSPGHFETPDELADLVRAAGFTALTVQEGTLEHVFHPDAYGQFLEEYGERALFESLDPGDARRLRRLTERYLRDVDAEAFVWRAPVVTVTARR